MERVRFVGCFAGSVLQSRVVAVDGVPSYSSLRQSLALLLCCVSMFSQSLARQLEVEDVAEAGCQNATPMAAITRHKLSCAMQFEAAKECFCSAPSCCWFN
eukprot:4330690-Amphidinium_carterae.1